MTTNAAPSMQTAPATCCLTPMVMREPERLYCHACGQEFDDPNQKPSALELLRADIAADPSFLDRPKTGRQPRETCPRGHNEWKVYRQQNGRLQRHCIPCAPAMWKERYRRAKAVTTLGPSARMDGGGY